MFLEQGFLVYILQLNLHISIRLFVLVVMLFLHRYTTDDEYLFFSGNTIV